MAFASGSPFASTNFAGSAYSRNPSRASFDRRPATRRRGTRRGPAAARRLGDRGGLAAGLGLGDGAFLLRHREKPAEVARRAVARHGAELDPVSQ
jgi:hypothetical protein